jgi:hypothetical protein
MAENEDQPSSASGPRPADELVLEQTQSKSGLGLWQHEHAASPRRGVICPPRGKQARALRNFPAPTTDAPLRRHLAASAFTGRFGH